MFTCLPFVIFIRRHFSSSVQRIRFTENTEYFKNHEKPPAAAENIPNNTSRGVFFFLCVGACHRLSLLFSDTTVFCGGGGGVHALE